MSLVKWVYKGSLMAYHTDYPDFVLVIPLTDLTELVEGLKYIEDMLCERALCGHFTPEEIRQETQRLLAQLEAHRKEGA